MGSFVDSKMTTLSPAELSELERLMSVDSLDLLAWLLGQRAPPAEWKDNKILKQLQEENSSSGIV